MPSVPARRAASRSHTLSPTTIACRGSTPSSAAAARNRSGSGLACRTRSLVTIGVSSASPSSSRAGLAVAAYPLVAIAHLTPAPVSEASSSLAPGSAVTEPICLRYSAACVSWSCSMSARDRVRPVSRSRACTKRPPLIPILRWMRHTDRSMPTPVSAARHAITCW